MSKSGGSDLREAIRRLHYEKDTTYRDVWKKRGEIISILANIARKIDRLAYVLDGAPSTRDESLKDTVVDLLVYSLKYHTYLANLDPTVAKTLFAASDLNPPYSDGPEGFEHLLSQIDMAGPQMQSLVPAEAAGFVVTCLTNLRHVSPGSPPFSQSPYASCAFECSQMRRCVSLQHSAEVVSALLG